MAARTRRAALRARGTTPAAASAAAIEAAEAARDAATDGDAVGGADPAALASAAAADGATFVRSHDREDGTHVRAHVRSAPPRPRRRAGEVEIPDDAKVAIGAPTTILIGRDRIPAAFAVVEVASLVTSHDARTFAPHPDYPSGVQERDYTRDPYERRKVEDNAARLIADFLVNNNPDSVNGPPICTVVEDRLIVMGGNSRAMSLRLAYEDGHAKEYRALLVERAGIFGLSAGEIDDFGAPALVRIARLEVTRDVSRALNESQTLDKRSTVDAVSAASRLSTTSRAILADHVDPDATLDAYLASTMARPLVASLVRDRVITPTQAPRLLTGADLSEEGRDHVRRVLIASLIPDVVTIERMRPSLRDLIARVVPAIVEARAYGHDVTPDLVAAVEDLADAAARGVDVERLDEQADLFAFTRTRSRTEVALALRSLLARPRDAVRAIRAFARLARDHPAGQPDLLTGAPPTTTELLRAAVDALALAPQKGQQP
jgi:hypothetical protein